MNHPAKKQMRRRGPYKMHLGDDNHPIARTSMWVRHHEELMRQGETGSRRETHGSDHSNRSLLISRSTDNDSSSVSSSDSYATVTSLSDLSMSNEDDKSSVVSSMRSADSVYAHEVVNAAREQELPFGHKTSMKTTVPTNFPVGAVETFSKNKKAAYKVSFGTPRFQTDGESARVGRYTSHSFRSATVPQRPEKPKQINGQPKKKPLVLDSGKILDMALQRLNNLTPIDSESGSEDDEPLSKKRKNDSAAGNTGNVRKGPGAKHRPSSSSTSNDGGFHDGGDVFDSLALKQQDDIIKRLEQDSSNLRMKNLDLEEKNRSLRNELKLYKEMKSLVHEFPTLCTNLKRSYKCSSCGKRSGSRKSKEKPTIIPAPKHPLIECKESSVGLSFLGQNSKEENFVELPAQKINLPPPAPVSQLMDCSLNEASSSDLPPGGAAASDARTSPAEEQTISFGSRKISYHRVKKARHGKATILASELTALVWTPLELAISTLNGRKGQFGKMQLDEEMVDGIINYVAKVFGKSYEDMKEDVRKSISFKLNNFSKTDAAKKLVSEHLKRHADEALLKMTPGMSASENLLSKQLDTNNANPAV